MVAQEKEALDSLQNEYESLKVENESLVETFNRQETMLSSKLNSLSHEAEQQTLELKTLKKE